MKYNTLFFINVNIRLNLSEQITVINYAENWQNSSGGLKDSAVPLL